MKGYNNDSESTIYITTNEIGQTIYHINYVKNGQQINSKNIPSDDILEEECVKDFLSAGIFQIRTMESLEKNKKNLEYMEIKNIYGKKMIIVSDSIKVNFSGLLRAIDFNRREYFEKYVLLCDYRKIKELSFKVSSKFKECSINLIRKDNQEIIECIIPYTIEKHTKRILPEDINLIQRMSNYFLSSKKMKAIYSERGDSTEIEKTTIFANDEKIVFIGNDLFRQIEPYIGMLMRDLEDYYMNMEEKMPWKKLIYFKNSKDKKDN